MGRGADHHGGLSARSISLRLLLLTLAPKCHEILRCAQGDRKRKAGYRQRSHSTMPVGMSEKRRHDATANLEFEAARVRDEIRRLGLPRQAGPA